MIFFYVENVSESMVTLLDSRKQDE